MLPEEKPGSSNCRGAADDLLPVFRFLKCRGGVGRDDLVEPFAVGRVGNPGRRRRSRHLFNVTVRSTPEAATPVVLK